MKRERVSVVDFISPERRLVPPLRITVATGLRVSIHDLNRRFAIRAENKHSSAISLVKFPVRASLFKRNQPPAADKVITTIIEVKGSLGRSSRLGEAAGC